MRWMLHIGHSPNACLQKHSVICQQDTDFGFQKSEIKLRFEPPRNTTVAGVGYGLSEEADLEQRGTLTSEKAIIERQPVETRCRTSEFTAQRSGRGTTKPPVRSPCEALVRSQMMTLAKRGDVCTVYGLVESIIPSTFTIRWAGGHQTNLVCLRYLVVRAPQRVILDKVTAHICRRWAVHSVVHVVPACSLLLQCVSLPCMFHFSSAEAGVLGV